MPTAQVTVTTADRVTAIMAAMPPLITVGTPQHTTADTDRVTMLPPIMVPATGALFAPHTRTTAPGIMAGMGIAGDGQSAPRWRS
jgi:hypothetical protein